MRHTLFVLPIAAFSLLAQTPNRLTEEQIANADKQRDVKLLRGLPKIRLGQVALTGSGGIANSVPEDEGRKLLFDSLRRYNVPVEWTPASSSGYTTEIPTLFLSNSVTKGGCTNGCIVVHAMFRLELFETVTLSRVSPVKWNLPVWSIEEETDFDPATNRDEALNVLKRLIEKFSLSYLAANR
jgi:hypothetical protein